MTRRTARALQWLAAALLVALFLTLGDTSQLSRLSQVSWPWPVGVLLASAGLVWSAAYRWRMIAIRLVGGGSVSFTRFVHYFLLGRLLGFLLPAEATDVGIRTLALRRSGRLSLAGAAYSVLLDRLFDFVVLIWLVIPALLCLGGWIGRETALIIGPAGLVLTPLAVGKRHRAAVSGVARLYAGIVRSLGSLPWLGRMEIPEFQDVSLEDGLGGRDVAVVYGLSVLKMLMVVARFYFVSLTLKVPVSPSTAFICVPLAQVAALVAFTPGGLGILEAGWYGILVWAGMAPEETVLLVVGWRLYTLVSLLLLVLGLQVWEAATGRRVRDAKCRSGE